MIHASDSEAVELSEVVVTASRRPETIQAATSSITAVTAANIAATGARDASDLAALVAGMTVTNLGPGRNKIFLRGLSDGAFTGQTQSTVGLYLDRVPITYNAPDPDLRLVDVDRIEVMRGPQGTLYGTGAVSGVVRIITRRPELHGFAGEASATRSQTEGGAGNDTFELVGNIPLLRDRLALRAVYYDERFSGYINDVALDLRRVNGGEREGGRLSLGARLNPGWSAYGGVVRQTIRTEDTHYTYRGSGALRRANLVREPHFNEFQEQFLTLEGQGDWGRLEASIAGIHHDFRSRYDASAALPRFGSSASVGAFDETRGIELVTAEATWSSTRSGRWRHLIGAFLSSSETRSNSAMVIVRTIDAPLYAEARQDTLSENALFGETELDLTPDLTLTTGARFASVTTEVDSTVTQRSATRVFEGRLHSEYLAPKIAVAWRPSSDLTLSAQLSRGQRTGSFNTAGRIGLTFSGGPGLPSQQYDGDALWSAELGVKAQLVQGRALVRAALFATRWRDIQSDQFLPSGLAYVVNVGSGRDIGGEVEARWEVTDSLDLRANLMVTRSRLTDPSAQFDALKTVSLPGIPGASANVFLTYRRQLSYGLTFSMQGGASYIGRSRLAFDAVGAANQQGDYGVGELSVGLERSHWTLIAFVENVTDSRANTFAYGDPFRLLDAQASTPLRPRTAGLSLRYLY